MANYSKKRKEEAVKFYLDFGLPIDEVANKFKVNKDKLIQWIDGYSTQGSDGLNTKCNVYTGPFKLKVVKYRKADHTIRETAVRFKIPSFALVRYWEQIYNLKGVDALFKIKRSDNNMSDSDRKRKKNDEQSNEVQELRKQIEYLKMENEYLKKLNALVRKRENAEQKKKL